MADVIKTIGEDFQFHGSSPRFLIDDRFYKRIGLDNFGTNQLLLDQLNKANLSFLDCRVSMQACLNTDGSLCEDIENLCTNAWKIHLDICNNSNYNKLDLFLSCMNEICHTIPAEFDCTKSAIKNFVEDFPRFVDTNEDPEFASFKRWWGRGQQYISLMRNPQ